MLNALDTELAAALADHAERAAADPAMSAWSCWAAPGARSARAWTARRSPPAPSARPFYRHWIRALNCLEDMPKVSLAVLHGYSIGGGLQLALACDLRLATDDAILGLGATRHGIIPDGAVLRLARVVGLGPRQGAGAAQRGRHARPRRAAIGLVNWVCPAADLDGAVAALLERLRHAGADRQRPHQAPAPRVVPPRPARAASRT